MIHISTKRLRAASVLSLALLAACGDGSTGPEAVALLSISEGPLPFEEATLLPGETLQLTATPMNEARKALDDRPVRWESSAPEVASVDDTGLVTAIQVGTANVVATSETVSTTVRINVAVPGAGGTVGCGTEGGLRLAVGEVRTFAAFDAEKLCLAGGQTGAAEYALVPFNSFSAAIARMRVEVSPLGTMDPLGPPNPDRGAAETAAAPAGPEADHEFHQRLNDRSQQRFASTLRSGTDLGPRFNVVPGAPSYARVPAIGEEMRLNVQSAGMDGCVERDERTGRVVAVTDRAVVVADVDNPSGGFDAGDYESFGRQFDGLVWEVDTGSFGEPSDIDDNGGRVVIFFTRAVNELTPPNSGSYVGGFFYNRDLFPRSGDGACAGSNEREMVYLMVPDPAGEVNGNVRSESFVRSTTVSVLAHEFQHLINDSRRLHVNHAPVWEERWLNEGLSHVAEELVFYEVTGLAPEQNLTGDDVATGDRRASFVEHALENVERLVHYLEDPQGESTLGEDNLATRGASWAFLRYAADRKTDPAGQRELWHALVNSQTQGLDNLGDVLAADPTEWLQDWAVALYTDDAGLDVESRHTMPSWNFRDMIPRLSGLGIGELHLGRYPLDTLPLTRTEVVHLHGGGAAYFRFAVPAGGAATIHTTVNGLPAPTRLKLSVVRTR